MTENVGVTYTPTTKPRLIGGLDNGLASGGLVVLDMLDAKRVVGSWTLAEPRGAVASARAEAREVTRGFPGPYDLEYVAAWLRAGRYVERVLAALSELEQTHGPVDRLAVESFDDQAQHAKTVKAGRWKTPLLLGRLLAGLEPRGILLENGRLVFQNSGTVLGNEEVKRDLARIAGRKNKDLDMLNPGDRLVRNEHTRSALMHARALALRVEMHVPSSTAA